MQLHTKSFNDSSLTEQVYDKFRSRYGPAILYNAPFRVAREMCLANAQAPRNTISSITVMGSS